MTTEYRVSAQVLIALVHHLLRRFGSLSNEEITRHLGSMATDTGLDALLTTAGRDLFTRPDGDSAWHLAGNGPVNAPILMNSGSPVTARRYRRSGVDCAVLPDGAETPTLRYLDREKQCTPKAILKEMHRLGWGALDEEHLLLHVAHSADFELTEGVWQLACDDQHCSPADEPKPNSAPPPAHPIFALKTISSVLRRSERPLTIVELVHALRTGYPSVGWPPVDVDAVLRSSYRHFVRIVNDVGERWTAYKSMAVAAQTATRPDIRPDDAEDARAHGAFGEKNCNATPMTSRPTRRSSVSSRPPVNVF